MHLILFTQTNCNLSQQTKKFLFDHISGFQELNVSRFMNRAKEFNVQSTPTLILFKDAKEIDRTIGFNPNNLTKLIEKYKNTKELTAKEE